MSRRFAATGAAALICATSASAQTAPPGAPQAGHDMADMPGMRHAAPADAPQPMGGALGPYSMSREASGTSWQPDASTHEGLHVFQGPWTIMAHLTLNGVYDWQSGPRGDEKTFVSGMAMLQATRALASGDNLTLRAMLSPEPFMGAKGYPLLLAAGETGDGKTPLVDRQHPHDLFMELSASYAHRLSDKDSAFVYVGLPGEPAFGPPAFMHRLSIMDSPEAPISHHWLDSTHISFGVATLGFVHGDWKLEASRYNGREPDQHRYDIETGALDSTAARLSWNPTIHWSLQGSYADEKSPEQLEPGVNQRKWSASAIYTVPVGQRGWWSTTAAWGRKSLEGQDFDAWALESALRPTPDWTIFGRTERVETDELSFVGASHGPTYAVSKLSLGAVRDWAVADHLSVGLGGLYALDFVPSGLKPSYGGEPRGAMLFTRLKLR